MLKAKKVVEAIDELKFHGDIEERSIYVKSSTSRAWMQLSSVFRNSSSQS
jgi:hypothetical protein